MNQAIPKHIDSGISYNFAVAKAGAILLVATGHFFPDSILWVPTTIGLFVFGFSSAFFTSAKYREHFSMKAFWLRKASRLGVSLLVVNTFLLVLFVLQGKAGIFSWQTPVNMLGLTGVIRWSGLSDPSPFGAGLWFFTVLILFYLLYPVVRLVNRSKLTSYLFMLPILASTSYLHYRVKVGYMLWFTAFAFLFGVFVERNGIRLPRMPAIAACFVVSVPLAAMLFVNYALSTAQFNYWFLIAESAVIVLWLLRTRLSQELFYPLYWLSGCVLEVYFVHSYVFVRPTGLVFLDYMASLLCVFLVSVALRRVATWLSRSLDAQKIYILRLSGKT